MENKKSQVRGLGLPGVLTIVFVVLKLVGVITWSWAWVLAPLWIAAALVVIIAIVLIVMKLRKNKIESE